jgi:hypothetical protein
VALLASPRFLLLAPAFVLLAPDPRLFLRRPVPLVVLALGCAASVGGYLALRGYSVAELRFNLAFSSALARVGPGYFREAPQLLVATAAAAGVLAWVHGRLPPPARRRFRVHVVYLVLVLLATLASTWPYLYPQNLFAPAAWLAVLLATAEGAIDWQTSSSARSRLSAGAWAAVAGCLLLAGSNVLLGTTVADRVAQDRALLATLRPGDHVLLAAGLHPVCVADASYYANPITDAEDRLAETVRRVRPRWPLPECDYLRDLREGRPALIDGLVLAALPTRERGAVEELLGDYEPTAPEDGPDFRRRPIYRRKAAAASLPFEVGVAQVGDEHVSRLVGDEQGRAHLRGHGLGRDAARPEDGQLAGPDLDRVAEVGPGQVADAERRRVAEVDRRPVGAREPAAHLDGADGLVGRQRPHRHDHGAAEDAGGAAGAVGAVHRHVAAGLDVPHRHAGLEQGALEGERAAEEEADEVVAPPGPQAGRLLDELAVAVDAVARQVVAQVGAGGDEARLGGAGLGDVEQRARLGVALAEEEEVEGQLARHDDEVGLDEAEGQAGRRAGQFALPGEAARLGAGGVAQVHAGAPQRQWFRTSYWSARA